MLVGFFSDGYAKSDAEDTPIGLIRAEAAEELSLPWKGSSDATGLTSNDEQAEFRLLFGALAGNASGARLALATFWWACFWRAIDPEAAERWRASIAAEWKARLNAGSATDPGVAFEELALEVVGRGKEGRHRFPLLSALEEHEARVRLSQQLADHADIKALESWRALWGLAEETTASVAAVLALFFVLRSGHLRLQAGPNAEDRKTGGLFHGKLYVVERDLTEGGVVREDTVVVMGSPNWSTGALFGRGHHANTEIAAISRVSGWPWQHSSEEASNGTALATQLVHTARVLFEDSHETRLLARWGAPLPELPSFDEVQRQLDFAEERGRTFLRPDDPEQVPEEVSESLDPELLPLARGLLKLIEVALGLSTAGSEARRHVEDHLLRTDGVFAGKAVRGAQADGAIRLLELLHGQPQEDPATPEGRGAFLADEAGLGKSVIAQIAAFGLILEKALDPRRGPDDWPLVTILAPRQLVVGEVGSGRDSGQWQRHRLELLDELEQALSALANSQGRDSQLPKIHAAIEWLAFERATPDGLGRRIRVLSHSCLQRHISFEGSKADEALQDFAHIAASEVVILDESHNFRNGGSSRTRLARFLLTLPVPGEMWPVFSGDGNTRSLLVGSDDLNPAKDPRGRRVLCLTATPFNNAFDDLITQIGHFGRCQVWASHNSKSGVQGVLPGMDQALHEAIRHWSDGQARRPTEGQSFEAFKALLAQVSVAPDGQAHPHLRSGRRLDPDSKRTEADESLGPVRDGGPTYLWPERYGHYKPIITVVSGVLDRLVSDSVDTESQPTHSEVADATQRLDSLLSALFVQRSRARLIRLMADNVAAAQFRAPKLPRLPLPLNEDNADDVDSPDVAILGRLFAQLGEQGTEGLSLFAYRLSTLRSSAGAGGSGDQKTSNLLGFQRMQLIKRLQSSRYAFLQTLLRGPLKRSITELAILEWLADVADSNPMMVRGLPSGWQSRVRERAIDVQTLLSRTAGQDVAHRLVLCLALSGKAGEHTPGASLRDWLGCSGPHEQVLGRLLDASTSRRVEATLSSAPSSPQREWLDRAIADVVSEATCQLVADVETCLHWSFASRQLGLSSVVPILSGQTLRRLQDDVERSGGARGLLAALRRHLVGGILGPDRRDLETWLLAQLREPRMGGLVGWFVAQAAARARGIHASGGDRTLVFSEYSDTVDYLGVVLQVLSRLAQEALHPDSSGRKRRIELAESILRATRSTVDLLHERAREIQLRSPSYEAPVPAFDELFLQLSESDRHERALKLASRLAEFSGLRTGAGAARLTGTEVTTERIGDDAEHDLDSEGDEPNDDADTPEVEAIVDAFAPWYRIDPLTVASNGSQQQARASAARLIAAAQHPIRVLVSTEVLAEGVNLQQCGVVVHFDLPWNPTRLIQRNGRVDRRIQIAYENEDDRQEIWSDLLAKAGQADKGWSPNAPVFFPVRQVYHLTVVPPEPTLLEHDPVQRELLSQKIESVRRTLFRKLRSIQLLFGLSSWPIVLRADEAKAVLGGELAVETPGFRRREELFARRADLLTRLEDAPRKVPLGTFTLALDGPSFRQDIARCLGGSAYSDAWSTLHEAGVQAWSSSHEGQPKAVRAGTEWREGVRALTAWALFEAVEDEKLQPRLLRWALKSSTDKSRQATIQRHDTVPAVVEGQWYEDYGWAACEPVQCNLRTLEPDQSADHDPREHPLSPCDASEEILDVVSQWVLLHRLNSSIVQHDTGEGVPNIRRADGTSATADEASGIVRAWQDVGIPEDTTHRGGVASVAGMASSRSEPSNLNLRLLLAHGDSGTTR